MKKGLVCLLVVGLFISLVLAGCGSQKDGSSKEVIDKAKAMDTVKEKSDYLIAQAKAFYNSDDFQGAIDIAQNILQYIDKDSQVAKDLLQKAKDALTAKVQKAAEDAKGTLGGFGK